MAIVEFLDEFLIASNATPFDTEDLEKLVVEGLRLPSFVVGVRPLCSEVLRSQSNFVPRQTHDFPRRSLCNELCSRDERNQNANVLSRTLDKLPNSLSLGVAALQ